MGSGFAAPHFSFARGSQYAGSVRSDRRGFDFARLRGMTRLVRETPNVPHMPTARVAGYTLIEMIVALLLFTIGGLALVATSALLGREMNTNSVRELAGRMAASRLEKLGAGCRDAASGRESFNQVESEWSVAFLDSTRLSVVETVSYPAGQSRRTDHLRAVLPCTH
jgi:type II secretory pathway pseudopilin PulG